MTRKTLLFGVMVAAVACSSPERTAPLSPTANVVDVAALNPDGSSLKFTAPTGLSPNGGTLDTLQPVFTWGAAASQFSTPVGVSYDFEAQNAAGNVVYFVEALGEITSHQISFELPYANTFWWRVRARRFADVGPWSGFAQIRTPEPPPPPPPPPTQPPGGGSGLPFPIPEACGPFGVGNRIACAAAVAGQSSNGQVAWRGSASFAIASPGRSRSPWARPIRTGD